MFWHSFIRDIHIVLHSLMYTCIKASSHYDFFRVQLMSQEHTHHYSSIEDSKLVTIIGFLRNNEEQMLSVFQFTNSSLIRVCKAHWNTIKYSHLVICHLYPNIFLIQSLAFNYYINASSCVARKTCNK